MLNDTRPDAAISDDELVARTVATADAGAFELLVRRHEARIHVILMRMTRNRALTDDLTQDTFLRAWQKLHQYSGRGSFGAWLARLAYNLFLHSARRTRRATAYQLAHADDEPHTSVDPATESELDRAMAGCSDQERLLLTLSYAYEFTTAEIASVVALPEGTVKSIVHRAKARIRRRLATGPTSDGKTPDTYADRAGGRRTETSGQPRVQPNHRVLTTMIRSTG